MSLDPGSMRAASGRPQVRSVVLALATVAFAVSVAKLSGCSMELGITGGGQQDIAAARAVIEDGGIPDPASITVEGFLSEHSIPIEEPEDAGLLYATAAGAWNADFDTFTPLATVLIGFGTTIDEETFERDPLNLCLVIDRSGSMGEVADPRSGISKLDAVKIAVDRLLGQLGSDDRVSIVAFDNATSVLLQTEPGDDIATIKSALDWLEAEGGTNLARGMRRGYSVLKANRTEGRSDRLFVFTDAELNWWNERRVREFLDVMEEFANQGMGATLFGVGTDFGHEVAYEISQVRGANYFFLSDYERIISVFDEEFDFLVTPVVYDVSLEITVPFEFDVADVFGIPVDGPLPHVLNLEIPTLFLSPRQGGGVIAVRLRAGALADFSVENTVAEVSLSYITPEDERVTGPAVAAVLPGGLDADAATNYFENDGVKRAVLLLNTALVLQNASEDASWYYGRGDYGRALERLTEFLPYFDRLAQELEDRMSDTSRSLSQERALVEQLLANIERRW